MLKPVESLVRFVQLHVRNHQSFDGTGQPKCALNISWSEQPNNWQFRLKVTLRNKE